MTDKPPALPEITPSPFAPPATLGAAEVHLLLLDLRRVDNALMRDAQGWMSASEQARTNQFKRGAPAYLASRWLLRRSLARYLGCSPAAVPLARTDKGKPYIEGSELQFSLSHSDNWALLAVTQGRAIGVDLEAHTTRTRSLQAIAERYFDPRETAQLLSLPAAAQRDYFYRLWTLKEALLKAIGCGISGGLDKSCFHWSDAVAPISAIIDPSLSTLPWQFAQWQGLEGALIALAYAAPEPLTCGCYDPLIEPAFP